MPDPLPHDQQRAVDRALAAREPAERPSQPGPTMLRAWAFYPTLLIVLVAIAGAIPSVIGLAIDLLVYIVAMATRRRLIHRAAFRLLIPHGGFVCTTCLYPLSQTGIDRGQCPECGVYYTRANVVNLWRSQYKLQGFIARQPTDVLPRMPPVKEAEEQATSPADIPD